MVHCTLTSCEDARTPPFTSPDVSCHCRKWDHTSCVDGLASPKITPLQDQGFHKWGIARRVGENWEDVSNMKHDSKLSILCSMSMASTHTRMSDGKVPQMHPHLPSVDAVRRDHTLVVSRKYTARISGGPVMTRRAHNVDNHPYSSATFSIMRDTKPRYTSGAVVLI